MFREMRRKKQLLSKEENIALLQNGKSGVLALYGDDGYPYAVPLSYVFADNSVYFHSAKSGHKTDAVKRCGKASFCVVEKDDIVPEKYTTFFRSVIVFGRIEILDDETEIIDAATKLALKYNPNDSADNRNKEIETGLNSMCIMKLTAEHITGKEAKELAQLKKGLENNR